MAPGYLHLLPVGVAGQADDLQAIVQGLRDVFLVVGRGDEEDRREVVLQLQVVVAEGAVLHRVEDLHERRGRVAPPVGLHLVDLVEHHHRVVHPGPLQGVDDAPGHGPHVGAAVTAYLALVAHPAQADALQRAIQALGGGHGHRGLAHTRRTHQAEDGVRRRAAAQRGHGQVLDDAVLDVLQSVVGLVEDAGHGLDVGHGRARLRAPGQAQSRVEVGLGHGHLGRERRQVGQPLDLLGERRRGGLGQLLLRELLQVGAALAVLLALFAQLFLQHLQALVQEDPPLLALEAVVHPLGDLVLEGDELVLLDERLEKKEEARLGVLPLQQFLLPVGARS